MTIDTEWAIEVCERFLALADLYRPPDPPGMTIFSSALSNRGSQAELTSEAAVVEQILDRVLPGWRDNIEHEPKVNRWYQHIEASHRAIAVLRRQHEIDAALGDDAPRLAASSLHPWVWDGARSLWHSGHYREAIGAAARKLNAETQNKLGRRDVGETDLFNQAFSTDPPKPGMHACDSRPRTTRRPSLACTGALVRSRRAAMPGSATPSATPRASCPRPLPWNSSPRSPCWPAGSTTPP